MPCAEFIIKKLNFLNLLMQINIYIVTKSPGGALQPRRETDGIVLAQSALTMRG